MPKLLCICVQQHSWNWFIYYRSHNVNRHANTEGTARKRPKLADPTVHLYPPMHGEDTVSYGRNLVLLKAELEKAKPRSDAMKDLMCRTFPNRWDDFVNHAEPGTLRAYLGHFPLLKKATYVRL